MKIVFAGTPAFACPTLQSLVDSEHEVLAVLTQPDRKKGRGQSIQYSPVKQLALDHDIPVMQPQTLKDDEAFAALEGIECDVMIVVAYGLLLPKNVLEWPKFGCLNVHGSLLPRWRGASPMQRAIAAGDVATGVAIMQMDEGMDTGPVYTMRSVPLSEDMTTTSLAQVLAPLGASALLAVLDTLPEMPVPQCKEGVTMAPKIAKSEAMIDWAQSAVEIERKIRAFQPWPVAASVIGGQRVLFWQAVADMSAHEGEPGEIVGHENGLSIVCGQGVLRVMRCQVAGKKAQNWSELYSGYAARWKIGMCFDSSQ